MSIIWTVLPLICFGLFQPISARTLELIGNDGYLAERHDTTTVDGYVLTMFRIPGHPSEDASAQNLSKPVVFLQHGLLCSSSDWVVMGAENSLAYLLVDSGYDVWLGNVRGNTHSRSHTTHRPSSSKFWDFSWHQIGLYDLPAMIDYVLRETGQPALHYVGHSQGTTSFFVMTSMRPEYNEKIRSMQALAPVAYMGNLQSPFLRVMAPFTQQVEWTTKMLGINEFLPSDGMLGMSGQKLCKDTCPFQELCANVLFIICGYNSPQLNRTTLPAIIANTPAGASVKQLLHYAHNINSGGFRQFDYGVTLNLLKYGSFLPPSYPLHKVTAPVVLHYGRNDWLAAVKDVERLSRELGNLVDLIPVDDPKWNHLDFTYGIDARSMLYDQMVEIINQWEQV